MTKKQTDSLPVMQDTVTDTALGQISTAAPADHWVRQTALEFAITFHKNNGGMTQPTQVVSTATVFLDFIKGDSK
jgi:hypothetical protein